MQINDFKKIMDDYNTNPLDDFVALSPKEMYSILYNPLEDSGPIQLKKIIPATTLEKIPAYRICKDILTDIETADGIKLTKIGNLPPKIIINIYNKKYLKDKFIEHGITKLRSEKDWPAFHSLHISMGLGGLLRKYKGKVLLTKKSKSYLSNEVGLFKEILKSYCIKFNWAYNDNYNNPYTGQFGFLFLIYLLIKYRSEPLDLKLLTDRYFKALPTMQISDEYNSSSLYTVGDRAIETRFLHRFGEWFGFVDTHDDKSEPYSKRKTWVAVTDILNEVFEYSIKSVTR